ncbi:MULTISPECIES: CotS family spore coat protein [Clostridium]|uniref:Predicted spore coat protein n=4 Tax=Clostridium TaxID=1485 RepID=D8GKW0_CLOLD|nr:MULTISPECIES: CotS family spore coat protein [Clostridium]ADK13293.1 predicted spore coat protein [Clostridium ljungdahlii DSM 13528]AGY76519.1 CotS family spore coat protein [Clostridium autoethanogenum DSM 10061]ALU36678.1 Spore coat protein CotS family [Clostridium autoethanogenum DSM 10061]OAA88911.1 Spore coat protein I [Clostridium ljungdahlii DSM 13528]OAA91711.1 Spore coat protein I [Clostridium coskatii]
MVDRYGEKKYLTKYDLCTKLFDRFDLKVYDVVPVRSVYMISTDKGEKILKKVDYTLDELKFIYNVLNYVRTKFPRIINFVKNKAGEIYTIWDGDMYCIMDTVNGTECNFSNPIELNIAAEGLGEFHLASEGFKTGIYNKSNNGKLIDSFKRRIQEMEFFKNIANIHEKKTEFDEIFIKNWSYYIEEIEKSIILLQQSHYYKLCSEEDKVVVCHHDLAYHNILINENQAYFIDFDYAIIDLKVHDLCNFINKVIKNFAFDIDKTNSIINSYCNKNNLSRRELEVLYAMLDFPNDFYTIARDYYSKRKEWEEEVFLDRLKRKTRYKEDRKEFLQEFRDKILN